MGGNVFNFKSPDFKRLEEFGFLREANSFIYETEILEGQFKLRTEVFADGEVKTELTDLVTGEPYTLHLVEGAGGAFVGAVRTEYGRVLEEISEKCFVDDVFKGDCAHAVINYVREKYGDELEFLWKDFKNAVWRRKDNKKWYAAVLTVAKRKLGFDCDGFVAVIDLRTDPEVLPSLLDGKRYFPAYHMNKKHWFTMRLDGSVPAEEICCWLDKSYALAKKG